MQSRNASENFSLKKTGRRKRRVALFVIAILSLLPCTLLAQTKKPSHKAAAAAAVKPAKVDCGGGFELRVSAATPAQGTLLVAEIRSPDTLSGIAG